MLLRRITEHVKAQNWTAVALDFVIVVVGVFIGLQVQTWYTEQDRRVADKQYMERLHGEVTELISIRENVVGPRQDNFVDLATAAEKVFGNTSSADLTTEECAAIQFSHIFVNPTVELPTINELLSAGRLDSLNSRAARDGILLYIQSAARANDIVEAINSDLLVLSRKYPDLLKLDAANLQDFGLILKSPFPTCDLASMRANQGFLNDLADNKSRFDTYYEYTLVVPTNRLRELHNVLDGELSLEHQQN